VVTRQLPWAGRSQQEIIGLTNERFEYSELMYTSYGITEQQQRGMWEQQHPLRVRRCRVLLFHTVRAIRWSSGNSRGSATNAQYMVLSRTQTNHCRYDVHPWTQRRLAARPRCWR
jgi:hypothetical protein